MKYLAYKRLDPQNDDTDPDAADSIEVYVGDNQETSMYWVEGGTPTLIAGSKGNELVDLATKAEWENLKHFARQIQKNIKDLRDTI